MLAIVMIITVVGAMTFEASAGMYEFLNWGDSKAVVKKNAKESYADYGMMIDEDGYLHFDRPYGTPGTSSTTFEPTEYVDIYIKWHDSSLLGSWSVSLKHIPVPKRDDNTVQVRDLMDEERVPSGVYDVSVYDEKTHVYNDEFYAHIERYTFSREIYGNVTYISPYDQLEAPSHLRWEDNMAKWEAVPHADRYFIRVCDEKFNIVFNSSTTNTFYQCVPKEGWHFEVQAFDSTYNYIESIWSNGQPLRAYKVTFDSNGGSGPAYGVITSGKYVLPTTTAYNPPSGGYKFVGWSTTSDGQNIISSVNLTNNITVYAVWNKYAGAVNTGVYYSLIDGVLNIYGEGAIAPRTQSAPNPSPFKNNTEIKKVVIGSGITQIGDWFFYGCTGIETLDLSNANSLYSIGNSAFSGCTALSNIIYPGELGVGITGLGANAFRNCSSLKGFCLSDGEYGQYLSYGVFEGCTSLQSVTLPKTLLTLAENTFMDCENLEMVFYGGSEADWAELNKYHTGDVLGGARLFTNASWGVQVGDDAYYIADAFGQTGRITGTGGTWGFVQSPAKSRSVQEVTVEEGITSLGSDMFFDCDFIKRLTLPSTLVRIEAGAIQQCNGLESLIIPSSVKQIASYGVAYNRNLTTLYLSTQLETINASAFTECSGLQTIYCDGTRDEFFNSTFVGDNNDPLYDATFIRLSGKCGTNVNYTYDPTEATLTVSGTGAMDDFTGSATPTGNLQPRPWYDFKDDIKHIVVENGVTKIGKNAFEYCRNVETAEIGNTVQSIGNYAFDQCAALTSVQLPESVTTIGTQAFGNCDSLIEAVIPGNVAVIPTCAFVDCPVLESILIPATVTLIKVNAFYKCPSLTAVYYTADSTQFKKIEIIEGNDDFKNASIYCNSNKSTGMVEYEGKWYYYQNGNMVKGWKQFGSNWRYFDESTGVMATGWTSIGGKNYYMNSSGFRQTGLVKISNLWYYFDANGVQQKGWVNFGSSKRYFDTTTGVMATGLTKINGTWYSFNSSGIMQTGWQGNRYFKADGAMATGLTKVDGKWYFFDTANGNKQTNCWQENGTIKRYFGSDGVMYTGLKKVEGSWYYFNDSGVMQTGWVKFGTDMRYFKPDGSMATGLTKVTNGNWYYFNSNGIRQYGWVQFGSNWRYFDKSTGVMYASCTKKIDGKNYTFNANGICTNK